MTLKRIEENWYLLYGGTSEDGRGTPVYEGRTVDPKVALKFYVEKIKKPAPYSIGKVVMIDNRTMFTRKEDDLKEEVKRLNRQEGAKKRSATMAAKKKQAVKEGIQPEVQGKWGAFA